MIRHVLGRRKCLRNLRFSERQRLVLRRPPSAPTAPASPTWPTSPAASPAAPSGVVAPP